MDYNAWGSTTMGNGGFFDAPNQFGQSPATGSKKEGPKRVQSVLPLVIKQIKDCKEDEFKFWGTQVHIVKIVGILRSCDVQSTKALYEVEDHTGKISALLWIEQDQNTEANLPMVQEGSYVKIYGSIRNQDGQKILMVLKLAPVENINEVHSHILEAIHARLMAENYAKGEANGSIRMNNPGSELSHSMMNFDGNRMTSADDDGLTPLQQKVFRIVRSTQSDAGVHRSTIMSQFPQPHHKDVSNALDFLVSEGHIFTTIDLDHFKPTDC